MNLSIRGKLLIYVLESIILTSVAMSSAALLAGGCVKLEMTGTETEETEPPVDGVEDEAGERKATVRFNALEKTPLTKAGSGMEGIRIGIYKDGMLAGSLEADEEPLEMSLNIGDTYTYYATANIAAFTFPVQEKNIKSKRINVTPGEPSGNFPMSDSGSFTVKNSSMRVDIFMKRLYARIRFSVDASDVEGLEITSVRIRQAATAVGVFGNSQPLITKDGDYASEAELTALNAGSEISLYLPENRQGVLLPDNADSWLKVPDSIPGKAGYCSYIEVEGTFSGEGEFVGDIVYRFYLGQDVTSDFNVVRNTDNTVRLIPSRESIRRPSWKIDGSDVYADIPFASINTAGSIYYITKEESNTQKYSASWRKLIRNKDSYILIGSYNGGTVGVSSNLKNWKFYSVKSTIPCAIAYGNGRYVVSGGDGTVHVSTDCIKWTVYSPGNITELTFGNGMFIGVGGKKIYSSKDGVKWNVAETDYAVTKVAAGDGEFIVVGNNRNIYKSVDGVKWTSISSATVPGSPYDLAYGNGTYVLSTRTQIYWSADGETWENCNVYQYANIVFDFRDGIFLAGYNGPSGSRYSTSLDGKVWEETGRNTTMSSISDVCIID